MERAPELYEVDFPADDVEALATEKPGARPRAGDTDLQLRLESRLPERPAVGRGNAVFVYGSCFHRRRGIKELRVLVDGEPFPVMAHGMPRRDLFLALQSEGLNEQGGLRPRLDEDAADPYGHSYRSGFWAIVPLRPGRRSRTARLQVTATLDDGSESVADLATLEVEPGPGQEPISWRDGRGPDEPLVAICMATYNPPIELFRRQIESIREQSHGNWVCVISDDRSQPSRVAEMEEVIADDPRFVISHSPRRLGFYHNFERAISMVPREAAYVILADQDDRWNPEKLEVLISSIGDSVLVYSDARVVDTDGHVISDTYWTRRRTNHRNYGSLLIANTITGAAALFRRDLLDHILPFPPRVGLQFHDHWIALCALALGQVNYVERPLYDYVQHGGAVLGHARANVLPTIRPRSLRGVVGARANWRAAFVGWRGKYFHGVCRLLLFARVLEMRCGEEMTRRKRRALRRFAGMDSSPRSAAWLAGRTARKALGLNETLGAEWLLLHGIAWRRIVALLNYRRARPSPRWPNDASLPREVSEPSVDRPEAVHDGVRLVRDRLGRLDLDIRETAPERINVLIPTIDVRHFFGGYIAKLNLARRLAELGSRARLVTVDEVDPPDDPLPRDWRRRIEAHSGLGGVFDRVELAFANDRPLEVSPQDTFVATTWWTAHRAHRALESLERNRFVYLIQEFEPYTWPMGSLAAVAAESYRFPHFAVFSTEILRDFFRRQGHGVFAGGNGERESISFQNAITPVSPPSVEELRARDARRLLFYARPEFHGSRNMFELGVLALADCVSEGVFGPEWDFYAIGATAGWRRLGIGPGVMMEMIPRQDQAEYAKLLPSHDVGLSLMYTPHPSLVPIEMASAGMLTTTNSCESKTPEAMSAISSNLITGEPSLDGIKAALREAVENAGEAEQRVEGAEVEWSRDWDTSFNEQVMERLVSFVAAT